MHSIFVRHTHIQLLYTTGLLRSRGAGLPVGGRRERISWPTAIAYEQWSPDDAVVHHLYHVPQPLMPPLLYPSSCRRRLLAQPDPASCLRPMLPPLRPCRCFQPLLPCTPGKWKLYLASVVQEPQRGTTFQVRLWHLYAEVLLVTGSSRWLVVEE